MEIGEIYKGFKLIKEEKVKDINSTGLLFEHVKSGARLLKLQNDDDNRVFSVSFRTPPESSNGLPHILEHSVLCGSRKFPVKEPFVELIKGSLNTFLNAMTFPDKTMYPVASKNEKDFFNLMDVYLDAVFYPNIYKYKEIMMQEGWHYHLENKDDELEYKGVVYNEMKGAFSSPESILSRKIQESLFPDTPYGVESGGDPDVIPELTQEEFTAFHKKYYHPSNSYIYLYGNGNIEDELGFIDENYLNNFDRININSSIPLQRPFSKPGELNVKYPIGKDEDEDDKVFFGLNFAVGKATDREIYYAIEILEYLLLETQASPLKNAIIDAGIGKDVFGELNNSILQPTFSIVVKNSNIDKKEKFQEVVFNTLHKLVEEGIDRKLIEATLNILEFRLRESEYDGYPKGLIYGIACMDSWLYDENPLLHLKYNDVFKEIRAKVDGGYFESIIKKYLLENPHSSLIVLTPKKGLADEKAEALRKELQEFKKKLSSEDIDRIISDTEKLKKRQESGDSPEDLNKIPLLKIEDIKREADVLPNEVQELDGVTVLKHDIFTNGICYLNLLFDTNTVPQENLMYIALLADIIGKVSTQSYSYEELSKEININTGGIRFNIEVYDENGKPDAYHPKLTLKSKAMIDKIPELIKLAEEIILKSKYDDKKRLKEIIQETRSQYEMRIFDRGHAVAARRLISYFSELGRYVEELTGISYYKFICEIEKKFNEMSDSIIDSLRKTANSIFNLNNLIVNVTMPQDEYGKFESEIKKFIVNLPREKSEAFKYQFENVNKSEGLITQGKVQYVASGFNYIKLGCKYSGEMQVLKTIISLDYLWNRVRVQGGAYGCFASFERNGNMYFTSYRDPNMMETIDVYKGISQYTKIFDADTREMTKYIIGTMSQIDYPLTPASKGEKAAANYIRRVTQEDIQNERNEILSVTVEKIRKYNEIIENALNENYFCVLGGEEKIMKDKEKFDVLTRVFE